MYCMKDTFLTARVVQEMGVVGLYEGFCSTSGIGMHGVVSKGETERVLPVIRKHLAAHVPPYAIEVRPAAAPLTAAPSPPNCTGPLAGCCRTSARGRPWTRPKR